MIRRTRRTKAQRAWQRVKQQSPVGWGWDKPIPEARVSARKALAAHIAVVRAHVFARDGACRVSGLTSDACDQLHEDPPRSRTRGLPMEERFNTRVCIRLNARIHQLVTEKEDPDREGRSGARV